MLTLNAQVILLLSNIELSPIDKHRFSTLLQVLGNPIDAIWSLIHKLHTWNRIYHLARRRFARNPRTRLLDKIRTLCGRHNTRSSGEKESEREEEDRIRVVATVLAGFEELAGAKIKSDEFYEAAITMLWGEELDSPREQHWKKAALDLSDGRTNEFLRALLAIALYILQVTSAFLPAVGGEPPTPPGGVIACALFLSYLVPAAVLSNCIGAFTSRRSCLSIISRFVDATAPDDIAQRRQHELFEGSELSDWKRYFHRLHFNGGNYTYRPFKSENLASKKDVLACILAALCSSLPVMAGFVGAFPILLHAVPSGFSCRHVWLLIIWVLWIVSAFISTFLRNNPHRRWKIILFKDLFIGIPSLVIVTLSAMGGFNSCSCWGRSLFVGKDPVTIPLVTEAVYKANDQGVFPKIVGSVIGFQLCFCAVVILKNWRGVTLMRWNEGSRRKLWEEVQETPIKLPQSHQRTREESWAQLLGHHRWDSRQQPTPGAHQAMMPGEYATAQTHRYARKFYMIFWTDRTFPQA